MLVTIILERAGASANLSSGAALRTRVREVDWRGWRRYCRSSHYSGLNPSSVQHRKCKVDVAALRCLPSQLAWQQFSSTSSSKKSDAVQVPVVTVTGVDRQPPLQLMARAGGVLPMRNSPLALRMLACHLRDERLFSAAAAAVVKAASSGYCSSSLASCGNVRSRLATKHFSLLVP